MQPNFPYYNAVDQIIHAEWTIPQLARQELLRQSIRQLWPSGHPTNLLHVAGTGGKGSTCRFLEVGLMSVGAAGAYMSPHIFDYCERFSINGVFAAQDELTELWEMRIRPHCIRIASHSSEHIHTFLEVSVLLALALFEKRAVEWAAIETHVGGRYDWTRGLDAAAALLTNVGSDHAHLLGSESWQRVMDKVGIVRPGVPFFTTETDPENLRIMRAFCERVEAPFHAIGKEHVEQLGAKLAHHELEPLPEDALLNMSYQRWNCALAFSAVKDLFPQLDEVDVLKRMAQARLLGRFWKVDERIYADVAHNVEKLQVLTGEIEQKFGDVDKILVLGASLNRAPKDLFARLARGARTIIITGATFKGQDPKTIHAEIAPLLPNTHMLVVSDPQQALQTARSLQGEHDVIVLTGSTYMIEQALNPDPYLRHINNTFGWRMQSRSEAQGTVQLKLPKTTPTVR